MNGVKQNKHNFDVDVFGKADLRNAAENVGNILFYLSVLLLYLFK